MTAVWLGLGSNLGDRDRTLDLAIERLRELGDVLRQSARYETAPVDSGGPDFVNLVLELETPIGPGELLRRAQQIERDLGRRSKGRNLPRTIDIDILLWGEEVLEEPGLTIPHPRLDERAFVLVPLNSLEPGLVHPVTGRSVTEMLQRLQSTEGVELHIP